ncbi:MAG: DUF1801 domain-containing protein [Flavobacteriaceae bacterium]
MTTNKTIPTGKSVTEFLEGIVPSEKKADAFLLLEMMESITGEKPTMWGPSIIGFGSYHYRYDSGREGDMLLTGFSPRTQDFSLYVGAGAEHNKELLQRLGKHRTGKSCLYIKRLSDVDLEVLKEIIKTSYVHYKEKHNQ